MRDERTYAIIGAAMRIHGNLGPGLLEVIYRRALAHELGKAQIPFESEFPIPVEYDGRHLGTFRADFLCHESILVEVKAVPNLVNASMRQLPHDLRATNQPLGLLLKFGSDSLQFKRVVAPIRWIPPDVAIATRISPTSGESVT